MKKNKKISFFSNPFTFLFYDYETFGIHTSLDKPAQFASIRTDINLNIIEKPKCFYCFPPEDYLPHPDSILITKITPQYTIQHGSNEYQFSRKIYNVLNQPNTCIIGYNNIAFDDEITRNIFYRNFLDPYEWSWKNNNSRWDLLNIVRVCCLLRPNGIKWPQNTLGLTIFKLSELTKINNIIHENVHDAIADVYATIEIARLIKYHQPKLFNFFFKYRNKNQLYKLIQLENYQPILYISSYFGAIRKNMSLILPLYWDEHNRNVLIAIDLFKDIKKIINFFKKLNYQEMNFKDLFNLGILSIYFNRCPILVPIKFICVDDFKKLELKNFNIDEKISLIKTNNFIIKNYIKIFLSHQNVNQKFSNVDLQIYNNFFNLHDKKLIKQISNTQAINFKSLILNFNDKRLKELFFRYKARNFFFILNSDEKKIWIKYCLQVFHRSYLKKYIENIDILIKKFSSDVEKVNLLHQLLDYTYKKYKILFYKNINLN